VGEIAVEARIDERIYRRFFEELESLGDLDRRLAHELRRLREEGAMTRETALIELYDRLGMEQIGGAASEYWDRSDARR
jgi:hypothetical protein